MELHIITAANAMDLEWRVRRESSGSTSDPTFVHTYSTDYQGTQITLRMEETSFVNIGGMGVGFKRRFRYETQEDVDSPEVLLGMAARKLYALLNEELNSQLSDPSP